MDSIGFTSLIRDVVKDELPESPFVIGKLDSLDGQVIFDGERKASSKRYAMLDSYNPVINDRVLLARVKGSYVIIGGINRSE